MKTIRLRAGKERSLLRRHPWVFEGSVAARQGRRRRDGARRRRSDGRFLAWAAYSPAVEDPPARLELRRGRAHRRRVLRSAASRARSRCARASPIASDGVRLVHGEADGLPGLVVDRYADTLCAQFLSAGAERWKATIADALLQATGARAPVRAQRLRRRAALEGLAPRDRLAARRAARTEMTIREHGWTLTLDVAERPQDRLLPRPARQPQALRRCGAAASAAERVLNCYCYTGGFSVAALAGGARARDERRFVGAGAGARRRRTSRCNGFDAARATSRSTPTSTAPCATRSRPAGASTRSCSTRRSSRRRAAHAERAARAYKDINRLALKLLEPGGAAVHVLVLGRHRRRPVPQDRRRRRHRCRRRRPDLRSGSAPRRTTRRR